MKKIVKSLLAAGVLFAAGSCEKDQIATKFNPGGEDATTAYFAQKAVSEEFTANVTGDQTLYVKIYRQNAQGEVKVGLDRSVPAEAAVFYEIPADITFKDGEYEASIPVKIKSIENFAKGVNYTATISVGDHHEFSDAPLQHTPQSLSAKKAATRATEIKTKYTSVNISTTLTLDWEPCYILKDPTKLLSTDLTEADYVLGPDGKPMLQTGTYTFTFWWNGYSEGVTLERAKGTTVFRMTKWGASEDVNIIFTVNPDKKVSVNGKEYPLCVVTGQYINDDYSDGTRVFLSDAPSFLDDVTYEDYPCYWDGERTFHFNFQYYLEDGRYFTAPITEETYELASGKVEIEEPAPAVEIDYTGASISQTGIKSHSLAFTPNDDAAYYYATVLKENVEDITVPDDAVDPAAVAAMTEEFLIQNGIQKDNPQWNQYFAVYYQVFLNEAKAAVYQEYLEAALADKLPKIREEIEKGTYKGEIPAIRLDAASEDAWDLGSDGGFYTAVAFSYDKTEKVKGIDYKVFIYNPEAVADMVQYELYAEIDPAPASGYFAYNSIYFGLVAVNADITSVRYALVKKADFDKAGLAGATDEKLKEYLAANGKPLTGANIEEVNDEGFETHLSAEPDTEYKLITGISNADATKYEVTDVKTEAAAAPTKIACATMVTDEFRGYYSHTHVFASFTGTEILNGYYLMIEALNETINTFITVGADGQVSLKDGVTDEDMIALIAGNGTAFTGEDADSDIDLINNGEAAILPLKGKPATKYVILAMAAYGNGTSSWTAAVQQTAYAPAVAFTQTVEAKGRNIAFNWSATPTAGIFVVDKVVYALVPKSVLTDAGVDPTMLTDEKLNDFAARIAAGGDEGEITMQQQNADKVMKILAEQGKTFQGDAAAAINDEGGVSKQFNEVASGEWALIALASDTYNTKLTVGQVTVQ